MQRIFAWQTCTCTWYRYSFAMLRFFAFSKLRNRERKETGFVYLYKYEGEPPTLSLRGSSCGDVHAIFMQCTCTISRFRECKGSLHDKRVPVPGTGTRLPCKDSLRSLNLEIVQVHCLNIAWTSPHDDPLKERSVVPPHICTGTPNLFLCVLYFSI